MTSAAVTRLWTPPRTLPEYVALVDHRLSLAGQTGWQLTGFVPSRHGRDLAATIEVVIGTVSQSRKFTHVTGGWDNIWFVGTPPSGRRKYLRARLVPTDFDQHHTDVYERLRSWGTSPAEAERVTPNLAAVGPDPVELADVYAQFRRGGGLTPLATVETVAAALT